MYGRTYTISFHVLVIYVVLFVEISIYVILLNTYVRLCLKEFFGTTLQQKQLLEMRTYAYKGEGWGGGGVGVEKSVLRYVRAKWMALNICCGIFFEHWYGQVH